MKLQKIMLSVFIAGCALSASGYSVPNRGPGFSGSMPMTPPHAVAPPVAIPPVPSPVGEPPGTGGGANLPEEGANLPTSTSQEAPGYYLNKAKSKQPAPAPVEPDVPTFGQTPYYE